MRSGPFVFPVVALPTIASLFTSVLIVKTGFPFSTLALSAVGGIGDIDLRAVSGMGDVWLDDDVDCRLATLTGPDREIPLLLRGTGDTDIILFVSFLLTSAMPRDEKPLCMS